MAAIERMNVETYTQVGDFRDTKWTQKVTDHMFLYAIQVMRILLPYKYKEIDLEI